MPAACPLAGVNIAAFCSGIGLVHLPLMPELFKSGATVTVPSLCPTPPNFQQGKKRLPSLAFCFSLSAFGMCFVSFCCDSLHFCG